jgi:hypothetical protein
MKAVIGNEAEEIMVFKFMKNVRDGIENEVKTEGHNRSASVKKRS